MAYTDVDENARAAREPARQPASVIGLPPSELAEPATESFGRRAWRRFYKNKLAVASLILLVLASLAAMFAPLLTHYSPILIPLQNLQLDQPPSANHWLGTDGVGRDLYTRLLYGLRGPIGIAFTGAPLCAVLGAALGITAGYFGGWIDELLSRITEIFFVVPGLILVILLVALFGHALDNTFGAAGRDVVIMLVLATDSWPVIMRLSRSETLSMKETQFVEAAVVTGTTSWGIIWRHLLPNMFGILLVQAALFVPSFLFATATLGLFGLGAQPPWPDLGQMIIDGAQVMQLNPVEVWAPTIVMTALILTGASLGDGLRDAFDTKG